MGGHAIPPGGHAATLNNATIETDTANGFSRFHASALDPDFVLGNTVPQNYF